ncbi:MAG: hypothetical protein CVV02_06860 [Firmicutes bacterium HGW-Firmicutes-7]|nr:MAG: hypothetical protein CVV02_06860 [Firmicutes bacterium HGW-Firmicutes-7]
MKFRKRLIAFLVMTIMVFNTFGVQATKGYNKNNDNNGRFKDVKDDHWAQEYIELMTKYGIINGYTDNTFKPESNVFRGEFAKMMVLTMQLEPINPGTPTFQDVKKGEWLYQHVETAKPYLTGFKSDGKYYFKPLLEAQREDMAVAIVKGLGIDPDKTDMSVLDNYKDKNSISSNLRKYVAAAINEGVMKGDNKNYFNPTKTLTRAEAATLLARLIIEEKVVFDETKVVIDDGIVTPVYSKKPTLTTKTEEDKIVLDWSNVESTDFSSYKVVLSKSDSTPSYPANGYAKSITSVTTSGYEIEAGDRYYDGDFGGKIEAGERYYVSITAVYGDKKYTSNVVRVTVPGRAEDDSEARTPVLTTSVVNDGIKLSWTETVDDEFEYYKVVLSRYNSKPSYPEDGYVAVIDDVDEISFVLEDGMDYIDGDIDELQSGRTYYVAITAVYDDKEETYTSNVRTVKIP